MKKISRKDLEVRLPIFLPDATRGAVKAVDSLDLKQAGIEGVVVNTYHLSDGAYKPVLEKAGGIKQLMNFSGLIVSDSGGWQLFSLIHRTGKPGDIADKGVVFNPNSNKKQVFTPEQSIQAQFDIGSDIMICLDDFTPPEAPDKRVRESVERTVLWAKKSKKEYNRLIKQKKLKEQERPLLLAVIQGGWDKNLRKECADRLLETGFDGYGFGGYVVNKTGGLDMEISQYTADLIPDDSLKFALGTGKPAEIAKLSMMGWDMFDCTLPTRDARHQRLYKFSSEPKNKRDLLKKSLYEYIYIGKESFREDNKPIDSNCDCLTCTNYTRAYLHHLFKIKDYQALRLATIHNLRHYSKLINYLRQYKYGSN